MQWKENKRLKVKDVGHVTPYIKGGELYGLEKC